jgi:rod shape-determining protein MreC
VRRSTITRLVVALALFALALLLARLNVSQQTFGGLTRAPRALGVRLPWADAIQHALSAAAVGTATWFDAAWQSLRNPGRTVALEAELAALRASRAALERELLEARGERAERGAAYVDRYGTRVVARVVAATFSPTAQALTVALDATDGVATGQPAAAHGALIGTVSASGAARATIQLLRDPRTRIGVELATEPESLGVLEADAGGGVVVTHIPIDRSVAVGAAVVSGATTPYVPRGMPIGTITEVRRDPDGFFQTAVVQPIVDPKRLTAVTIFLSSP